jgi:hypothetical protein
MVNSEERMAITYMECKTQQKRGLFQGNYAHRNLIPNRYAMQANEYY